MSAAQEKCTAVNKTAKRTAPDHLARFRKKLTLIETTDRPPEHRFARSGPAQETLSYMTRRFTNRTRTGILCARRAKHTRAASSETPPIS